MSDSEIEDKKEGMNLRGHDQSGSSSNHHDRDIIFTHRNESMMNGMLQSCVKLTGMENQNKWYTNFEVIASLGEFTELLEGKSVPAVVDKYARICFYATVDHTKVTKIVNLKTGKEIWEALQAAYCKPNMHKTLESVHKYVEAVVDFNKLPDYVNYVDEFIREMEQNNITTMKQLAVMMGLAKLSTELDYTKILDTIQEAPLVPKLFDLFFADAERIKRTTGVRSTAFAARGGKAKRQCQHCKKTGHSQDQCWILHPEKREKKFSEIPTELGLGFII